MGAEQKDSLFEKAEWFVLTGRIATVPYLQRCLGLGYGRAAVLLDQLEDAGVIGPDDPAEKWWKPERDILLPDPREEQGEG